jgi:hypothetical protein
MNYMLGILGTWLLCDGIISIRLYLNSLDESGKRLQSWTYDHSIRLIRIAVGLYLIIAGGLS